ncbi:type II secretion system protein GspN, partial [Thermodesulfobacteriota bacterium]
EHFMKEKKKRILWVLFLVLMGFVLLPVFLYLTFPYDQLNEFITKQTEPYLPGFDLSIGRIRPYRLTGFEIKNILIQKSEGEKGASAPILNLQKLRFRCEILPLVARTIRIPLSSRLYKGTLDGRVARKSEDYTISAEMKEVDLAAYLPLKEIFGISIGGIVSGKTSLKLPDSNPAKLNGTIDLSVKDITVGESTVHGFTLPAIQADQLNGRILLANGKGTFKDCVLTSSDLEGELTGNIFLSNRIERSTLKLNLKFKLSGDLQKNFGSLLAAIRKPDSSGYYNLSIIGTLSNPRMNLR